ncbi:MAG: M13 family metallopeptidase N-terminal domain-containing protein [Rheinheimera sp.]|nr:M13 family metallopeptidase N-terminal domain-containing protein [Rheinheimera sp.]
MNEAAIEALGVKPISADLTAIAAIKDATELATSFGQLQGMGVSIPLGWYVNNDAKNSTQYAVYLGQSGLGLPDRDYYLKDDEKSKSIRDAYVAYVKDMLTLAGVADAEKAAARIMALETKIAEKQWSRVENRDADKTYNKFAAADLAKLLGGLPWADYAKAVQVRRSKRNHC